MTKKNGDDFLGAEMSTLLDAESDGKSWQSMGTQGAKEVWIRSDNAMALYDPVKRQVYFMSDEYFKSTENKKASQEQGF